MAFGKRSILKDVSISELQRMRDEGMSNAEIAENLDVCYHTIYKLLGKQPENIRKPRKVHNTYPVAKPIVQDIKPVVEEPIKEEPAACLVVQDKLIELSGTFGSYTISTLDKKVTMHIESNIITVEFDKLKEFISEICAIERNTKVMTASPEMW